MAEQADTEQTVVRIEEIESSPKGVVKRWMAELALADKAEEDWRKEAGEIYDLYDGEKAKANSFNILWSNTETLLPAIYNSTPQPDVRRRFRDPDPTGKVASTVLERSLSYQVDDYDFDAEIEDVALDLLLPGRGVARIEYEPQFVTVGPDGVTPGAPAGAYQEPEAPDAGATSVGHPTDTAAPAASAPKPYEKIAGQSAKCCHVQWDKFRRGPGKRWPDVPWVAFEHEFTYDMAVEKFGKAMADALKFDDAEVAKDLFKGKAQEQTRAIFKICKVHEIWDKERRRVLFIAPSYKDQPCREEPDPLKLRGFFPLPRPVYAIPSTRSLVPKPLYRMYKQQALELDKVSARINKIVTALKVRGLYAAHIKEAGDLLESEDNSMTPIENPAAIADHGGLEKLVWILPVDLLARTLEYLYKARDQIKQAIYEITGIADILRGATDPNETLGAQQLKSQWGSLRIQKMQREIQRFIRDLMRLKAEVIAEQFTPEQLAAMTNVQLPDQQAKAQAQMAVQQAQVQQGPLPPEAQQKVDEAQKVLAQPAWEDITQLLRSDAMRQYRVDIETDSTVAETINKDMQGLAEVLQQVSTIIGSVAQGLPMDVAKSVALAVVRRARLGSAVEDALEALQQPPPPQAPAPPPDHSLEVAQIKAQSDQALAQMKEQAETQRQQLAEQAESQRQQFTAQMDRAGERYKVELDAAVKVIVAQIAATKAIDDATARNAQREFSAEVQ